MDANNELTPSYSVLMEQVMSALMLSLSLSLTCRKESCYTDVLLKSDCWREGAILRTDWRQVHMQLNGLRCCVCMCVGANTYADLSQLHLSYSE